MNININQIKKSLLTTLLTMSTAVVITILYGCSDNNTSTPNNGNDIEQPEEPPIYIGNPPVVINEIATQNINFIDEFGETPSWIELYNPQDVTVNLAGYYLTDRADRKRWVFGDVEIAPNAYQVVFMSGRNKPSFDAGAGVNLMSRAIGAWAWGDSENTPIAGNSTASVEYSQSAGIGGSIFAANNAGTGLTWSSAEVCLKFAGWDETDVTDLSNFSEIIFSGYVSAGAQLNIRFAQAGVEGYESCGITIVGRGVGEYVVNLGALDCRESSSRDLSEIRWIRFANAANFFGAIDFNFTSITATGGSTLHASFELSRNGGAIYLIDTQRNIRDTANYPAIDFGFSLAKNNNAQWLLARPPTPGGVNNSDMHNDIAPPPSNNEIPQSGFHQTSLTFTIPAGANGAIIRCDTTGRMPANSSTLMSGSQVSITQTTIMRCATFSQTAHASAPIMRTYIVGERLPNLPVVSIAVDPFEMFDRASGLYELGPNAQPNEPHYGANFWSERELPIHIDFFEGAARHAWSYPAGIRIFGGWSRAAAKKSLLISFRSEYGGPNRLDYPLFPDHPHLTRFKHFILRNNGNNAGLDYIRDMLMTSLTDGLDIDYQKGRAAIVYFNGQYFGIHNIRERSNSDYFETNYGANQNFVDLLKVLGGDADGYISEGSDADYRRIENWLETVSLESNENFNLLDKWVDIWNYTNYIHSQIFFNNRDWPGNNMKLWRVSSPPSRWRWFLYDTDHGFGSFGDNTCMGVSMFDFVTSPRSCDRPDWPNPPHATFLTRKLFENITYREAFVNRFSILLTTHFNTTRVNNRIETLMTPIRDEITLDTARWNRDHQNPANWRWGQWAMAEYWQRLTTFATTRPNQVRAQLEQFMSSRYGYDMSASYNLTLSINGNGKIFVNDLEVPDNITFRAYSSIPVTLRAESVGGANFVGWSDGVMTATRRVTVSQAQTLIANFD